MNRCLLALQNLLLFLLQQTVFQISAMYSKQLLILTTAINFQRSPENQERTDFELRFLSLLVRNRITFLVASDFAEKKVFHKIKFWKKLHQKNHTLVHFLRKNSKFCNVCEGLKFKILAVEHFCENQIFSQQIFVSSDFDSSSSQNYFDEL